MLCEAKHNAIVQWFNSLTSPSNNISSLSQLKDGSILQNHINEGTQESQERAVTSNDKKYNFFKEEDSRAIFENVKKHINETLRVSSEELIDYEGCLRGSEAELAKVAAFVLCITVTLLLEKPLGNPRLSLLSQLDDAIQVEIRECMDCIMVYPSSDLRRADLVRVLGRSTLIKEKLIRVSNSPAKLMTTPRKRGRPKKFADFETPLCSTPPNSDEGPKILLQMMESPKVKIWSNMAVKEREILILRRELELADNKIIDQRVMIEQLRNDLDKRGEEFQQLKEKVRELQEEADARDQSMDARSEAMEATVSSANQSRAKLMATISAYEIEIASLKTEVDIHKNNSEDLISKLERYREKDAVARGQLAESQSQLQSVRAEKESLEGEAERLRFELSEMKGMISVYKDKLQEREKEYESKLLECSTPEIVGDFFEEDYRATREKLLEEELENAKLRRLLEEKTALCEEQRALLEKQATAPFGPRSGNSDDSEERKWTDYREELPNGGSGHESSEPDLRDDKGGVALNELVLLAERAFAAHAEGPMPELPGGGLDRVKSLLQELLASRAPPPAVKGEPFETKSDEVSLDSGVPASDPGSNEEEPSRPELPNPFASRERLFGENESLQYLQKALRLKEEFEKKNNDLLESVGELTAKLGEASQKLEECQRGLSESEAQKKLALKKYSKLKEYTLKVEGKLEDLKLCKSELKSRQEELMEYRARVKELQASIALYRDSRDKFETRADLIEERNEELEKMNTNLQLELETEKCKCKELASRLEELKLRQEWSYQSDYRDQGRPPKREKLCVEVERNGNDEGAPGSYFKVNAVFCNKDSDAVFYNKSSETVSTAQSNEVVPHSKGNETIFSNKGNESAISGNPFNMSLHSTLVAEDEDLFFHHTHLPPMEEMDSFQEHLRLRELRTRNSLYKPHLRSAYLLETQGYKKAAEGVEEEEEEAEGARPKKKLVKEQAKVEVAPPSKRLPGIFKTPRGLHRLVQRREEERKRKMGIRRPRLKL